MANKRYELYCIAKCIVLYCVVLYCIVLYCIGLHCIILNCIVLYCIVFYYATAAISVYDKGHEVYKADLK